MKSITTFIGVLLVLTALAALCYGGYLGLVYLWQVYAGLDVVVRVVLLSAMAVMLLSALVVAGAIKSAGLAASRRPLAAARLRLYRSLVESCRPLFAPGERPQRQACAEALAGLAAA